MADARAEFGLAVASIMAAGESLLSEVYYLVGGYDHPLEKSTGHMIEAAQTWTYPTGTCCTRCGTRRSRDGGPVVFGPVGSGFP